MKLHTGLYTLFRALRAYAAAIVSAVIVGVVSLPIALPLCAFSAKKGGDGSVQNFIRKSATFTLYSDSSSGKFSAALAPKEILSAKSETVFYTLTDANNPELARKSFLSSLFREYQAEILWREGEYIVAEFTQGKTVSYYCYAKKIGLARAKAIGGKYVNLHVVFRGNEAIVGVPLVYCGY